MYCSHHPLRGEPLARPQLFVGSVPQGYDEERLLRELAAYGVHPIAAKLRPRDYKEPLVYQLGMWERGSGLYGDGMVGRWSALGVWRAGEGCWVWG